MPLTRGPHIRFRDMEIPGQRRRMDHNRNEGRELTQQSPHPIVQALDRRHNERRNRRAAFERQPEAGPPKSDLDLFLEILAGPKPEANSASSVSDHEPTPLPLNGADLLRHALSGRQGTINGASVDSAASVVRDVLAADRTTAGSRYATAPQRDSSGADQSSRPYSFHTKER